MSCSASEMNVVIDSCIYQDQVDLVWGAVNDCEMAAFNTNSTFNGAYEINTALDDCGTSASASDGVITFTNSVQVAYRHNFLKMFPDPEIIFSCEFDSQVDNVSASHSVDDGTVVSEGTSSNGSFEFTLNMVVPDEAGAYIVAPDTDVVTVGERIHFQISNDNPLDGVHFFINECTVSDGVSSHSVFANNCGGNGVDAMIEGPQHAGDVVQGNYIAFVFSQSAGNTMDLTCSIYACLAEECEAMMNTCDGRRRRSALPESAIYYVSKTFTQI